jgi:hypothetical protein
MTSFVLSFLSKKIFNIILAGPASTELLSIMQQCMAGNCMMILSGDDCKGYLNQQHVLLPRYLNACTGYAF